MSSSLFLSLFNSLVSLSSFPPSLSQLLSVELKIKPCHLPTYRTDLCSLGCESAHYSNKYLRGVRGILRATSKTPTHPSKPSMLLVPAGVLFCLLELALIACFSRHLSHVQEQHLNGRARLFRSHIGFNCSTTLNVKLFNFGAKQCFSPFASYSFICVLALCIIYLSSFVSSLLSPNGFHLPPFSLLILTFTNSPSWFPWLGYYVSTKNGLLTKGNTVDWRPSKYSKVHHKLGFKVNLCTSDISLYILCIYIIMYIHIISSYRAVD